MRFLSFQYLVYLGIVISLMNCQYNKSHNYTVEDVSPTITKEIPIYKNELSKGEIDHHYLEFCEEASSLGLQPLTHGYDSLQIRIWLGHSMAITKEVVIFKYNDQKWTGQLLSYSVNYDNSGKLQSLQRMHKKIYPKSGWKSLMNNLFQFQLLTLPNEDVILGYNGCGADGISYHFEWATRSKYRWSSYCNPDENKDRFWQAQYVINIAQLLEHEFDFTYTK